MADNFDALNAAVARIGELVTETLAILQNPATDNNDQSIIDALTVRLSSIGDALAAVQPATPAPAPVEAPPAAETPAPDASAA